LENNTHFLSIVFQKWAKSAGEPVQELMEFLVLAGYGH